MSRSVTRNGAVVECADPTCICNARITTTTKGAIDAAAEEQKWLNAIVDAAEEQLRLYREWVAAPKSERDNAYEALEKCGRDIIARFFPGAGSWSE